MEFLFEFISYVYINSSYHQLIQYLDKTVKILKSFAVYNEKTEFYITLYYL